MSKKSLILILFAIVLAAVYVVWFSDWFRPKKVEVFHTYRNFRQTVLRGNANPSLIFGIRPSRTQLTELKVVVLSEYETNRSAVPLWHLISDSNSVPLLRGFYYGEYIRGMRPAIKGDRAEALETNVTYRMFITAAGNIKGEHDFELKD